MTMIPKRQDCFSLVFQTIPVILITTSEENKKQNSGTCLIQTITAKRLK